MPVSWRVFCTRACQPVHRHVPCHPSTSVLLGLLGNTPQVLKSNVLHTHQLPRNE